MRTSRRIEAHNLGEKSEISGYTPTRSKLQRLALVAVTLTWQTRCVKDVTGVCLIRVAPSFSLENSIGAL